MAEETPSLQIDTDWKKQAQAEKKRLAEQQAAARAAKPPAVMPTAPVPAAAAPATSAAAPGARRGRGGREMPAPGFASLVQSVMTQVLFYLGEIAAQGGQPMMDLDMAKHHLDTLAMLEEKTKNNLDAGEQRVLDAALYETRSRFIGVASQLLGP